MKKSPKKFVTRNKLKTTGMERNGMEQTFSAKR